MTSAAGSRTSHVRVVVVADDEHAPTDALSVAVTKAGRRPCPAVDGRSIRPVEDGR